ncbi:MAG: lactate utilization protein [Oscillospiraceae bacterium]
MSTKENNILKIRRTMAALGKNNINAYFAESHEEAAALIESMVPTGSIISCGGSVTLSESGVLALMKSGKYHFLDRSGANTPEEVSKIYAAAHNCDVYFTSANAITENGELYNVDGNGNRTAAIIHGPKKILVIAGINKIVRDLDAAVYRVKTVAAPCNGKRLGTNTPCALTGICAGVGGSMTDGCAASGRMCAHYLVSAYQRVKGRITVIFLNEELGY